MTSTFMDRFFSTSENNPHVTCKTCNVKLKCWMDGHRRDPSNLYRHWRRKHSLEKGGSLSEPKRLKMKHIPPNVPLCSKTSLIKPESESYPTTIRPIMSNIHDEISFDMEDIKLIHPFSLIISGPTSTGKSTLLFQILENLHENTKPIIQKVVYIYGVYQEAFENYPNIFFTDDLDYMM